MYYNCHIHTFKDSDVPQKFLPLALVRVLSTKVGFRIISNLLNNLNPLSDKDTYDRYVKFFEISKLGSQEDIFEACKKFYPADTRFAILAMDMAYMGAGDVPRKYEAQLEELARLKTKFPQILPFVHIDPRRKGFFELLKKCVEQWNFKGVKIYPSLGYFPYDNRLDAVYEYCVAKNLPIITHCSPYNPVHFKGSYDELYELLKKSKTRIDVDGKNKKELCSNFTNPKNWEEVLKKHPKLKVCLAHFGSSYFWGKYIETPDQPNNWFVTIKDMLPKYENLYTDISFTLSEQEYFPLLKVLLADDSLNKKILFGSDYYMVETEATERRFALDLRAFIDEANFKLIATTNPERFFNVQQNIIA